MPDLGPNHLSFFTGRQSAVWAVWVAKNDRGEIPDLSGSLKAIVTFSNFSAHIPLLDCESNARQVRVGQIVTEATQYSYEQAYQDKWHRLSLQNPAPVLQVRTRTEDWQHASSCTPGQHCTSSH